MEITQVGQKLPDVNLRLTPEEATYLRRLFGALSVEKVQQLLAKYDVGDSGAIHDLTYQIFDTLDDLNY